MPEKSPEGRQLCYLQASRVESSAGELSGLTVHTQAEEPLGTLSGVLIDPVERRIRYFVVDRGWFRSRRYLISADHPVQVEHEGNTLLVNAPPGVLKDLDEFDSDSVREFSSEDAITAMFARWSSASGAQL